jgi:hypothetical protein
MRYYVPSTVSVSALLANFDTDLLIPAGHTIEITDETCIGNLLGGTIMTYGGAIDTGIGSSGV